MAKNPYFSSLIALTSLFFMWGFITSLNDILIPHLKALFTLNYTQVMLVQFCFFMAYFIVSIPSGMLVEKIGYQRGIVTGLLVVSVGCLLFYLAAGWFSYPLFLGALFILASGITLLQVAANPYVTILGDAATASSRLTMTQAFNSLGTTLGPALGSALILAATVKSPLELTQLNLTEFADYQRSQADSVQIPYLWLAAILIGIALVFMRLHLPNIRAPKSENSDQLPAAFKMTWPLMAGSIGIFVYVGAEVSIGSFLINFLGEAKIAGLEASQAGTYVSYYWGGAMIGRFIGALVMQKYSPAKVLAGHALMAALLVTSAILSEGHLAMYALLSVGLCNSIMFPTLFSLALTGLGDHTGQGSGILCAAIVGGAIVPLLQGVCADAFGIQNAFWVPVVCYLYIVYFGVRFACSGFKI